MEVVAVLTDSPDPRRYWSDLKRRVQDEGYRELYAECVQLIMRSLDGKRYATDAADAETMLRIVQSIPAPRPSRSSGGWPGWALSGWKRSPSRI